VGAKGDDGACAGSRLTVWPSRQWEVWVSLQNSRQRHAIERDASSSTVCAIKMVTGNLRFTRKIYSVRVRVELERWCTARVMCARVCVRACRFFSGVCDQRVRAVTNRHCCYTNAHTAKTGRIYFAEKPTGDYKLSPPYRSHRRRTFTSPLPGCRIKR
jgi:hypothetical protein